MEPRERSNSYEELMQAAMSGRMSRRQALKRAGVLGLGASAAGALLAACGGDDDDADETPTGSGTGGSTATAASDGATTTTEATSEATAEATTGTDSTPAASGSTGGTFIYVDGTEPPALDPPTQTGPFQHVIRGIFEPLLSSDNDQLEPEPRLATDWEIGEDNLTWTFNLKQGVMFHAGTEFTSEAVKFTYDRVKDPELTVSRRSLFDVIEETVAVEPYVVQIKTAEVFPDLAFFLSDGITSIVDPVAAQEQGPEDFALNPSGTGPFKFLEWVPNDHITLERFDDYYDGPANVDQVIFKPVPESSAREAMLRAGEVHLIYSPPTESVAPMQDEDGIVVVIYDSLTHISWEMRVTQPPFNDVKVRHAMNYAVDKQAIIDQIMSGLGKVAVTPAPPGVWGAIELEPYEYDPERAKQLMEEAGYADGFDGTFFFVPGRWAGDEQVAQATQSYWAQIGATMEIVSIDMGSLGEWLSRDPDQMAGHITGLIRTSTYIDYHLYRLFHPTATTEVASQRSGYVNEEVGRLIDAARATFDEDERAELYAEVQRIVWEDAPFVWMFTRQDVLAHQEGVTGFKIFPDNLLLYKDVQVPS